MPKQHQGSRPSTDEVGEGHVEDAGDPQKREERRILTAGFDLLEDVPAEAGAEVQLLLGDAPGLAFEANALAEDTAVLMEPGVVVGCVHSTNRLTKIILSQHVKVGISGAEADQRGRAGVRAAEVANELKHSFE
ncbi:hypothetical protein [Streptomyces sp. M92]|uniref:hypothetical protein n=1 Tax=Streptomyces sp. M92 TaxID=2944250 RepID=UPI003FA73BE5